MMTENLNITLSREYEFAGKKTNHLVMREPNTRDIGRTLTNTSNHKDDKELRDFEKEKFLIALLCDLSPSDMEMVTNHDYDILQLHLLVIRANPEKRYDLMKSLGLLKKKDQ